jgi:hypothetical protein
MVPEKVKNTMTDIIVSMLSHKGKRLFSKEFWKGGWLSQWS